MFKRFMYWLAKRDNYKSLIYWHNEIKQTKERLIFCKKALKYYEGGRSDDKKD